jgi:hypothetical protein
MTMRNKALIFFLLVCIGCIFVCPLAYSQKWIHPADVLRVASLNGSVQIEELRVLLAGDWPDFPYSKKKSYQMVFVQEKALRQGLLALITDATVSRTAIYQLSIIGIPEDMKLIIEQAQPGPLYEKNRWAYYVACALLSPTSEKEWSFLRRCALNEYEDRWVDAGAIQTLKLLASPKSREILEEAREINKRRAISIEKAIQYIKSVPPSLSDKNLEIAGKKVARAIRIGSWIGNKRPYFNTNRDMAIIDCEFLSGNDQLIYTMTFHKQGAKWDLRGVRETGQALIFTRRSY